MTREEHKQIVNQILGFASAEHQADASRLLTQLTDDYEQTLTSNETLTTTNNTLTQNNERLRAVNTDLFLKVGVTNKNAQNNNNNSNNNTNKNNDNSEGDKLPTIESLFNEKGELI